LRAGRELLATSRRRRPSTSANCTFAAPGAVRRARGSRPGRATWSSRTPGTSPPGRPRRAVNAPLRDVLSAGGRPARDRAAPPSSATFATAATRGRAARRRALRPAARMLRDGSWPRPNAHILPPCPASHSRTSARGEETW